MKIDAILNLGQRRRRTLDRVRGFATVVGAGSIVIGTLKGKDNYAVYGRVEGDCDLTSTLVLGESGHWIGNVRAAVVVIAGTVEGNVTATEKLELAATARIHGDLASPVIAIAEGALYDGEVRMETKLSRFDERRQT